MNRTSPEIDGGNDNIPMKGTGTGFSSTPVHPTQSAKSMEVDATNSMGSISSATQSDAPDAEYGNEPRDADD